MEDLGKEAFGGLLGLLLGMAVLLFLPAWTLRWWQAWLFLAVFGTATAAITLYLLRHDRALLQRRLKAGPGAEKERSQKLIQVLASLAFIANFLIAALDHRHAWSTVPPLAVAAGELLVVLGLLAVFLVFRANSYTSAIVEIGEGQQLVSSGPYAVVRHPMYSGALLMLAGIPPALGSWWALLALLPMTLALAWRLLEEERFLLQHLAGYAEYRSKVRYRLLPLIW